VIVLLASLYILVTRSVKARLPTQCYKL